MLSAAYRPELDELQELLGEKNPNNIDFFCTMEHCMGDMLKALIDPDFVKEGLCENGCTPYFYNDTTPMKLHYQNCTTQCALTYQSDSGNDFMNCAMTNNCMTFAPIGGECPKPEPDANTNLASLEGEWWQQYGHNELWDCYPCQHIHKMEVVNDTDWCAQTVGPNGPVQAPCWSYTYSYDLYLVGGKTKYFQQTWQLPYSENKGEPIDIYYQYMGSTHNETWYILSATDNYVVLVDCSYMSGWTNVGSILWVRPHHILDEAEMNAISEVYDKKMGWTFPDDFCLDKHEDQCTEPSSFASEPIEDTDHQFLENK